MFISIYFLRNCLNLLNEVEYREKAEKLLSQLGVRKVYVDIFRDVGFSSIDDKALTAPEEIDLMRNFLKGKKISIAAGVALGAWADGFGDEALDINGMKYNEPIRFACMSSLKTRKNISKIMEYIANYFDEVQIDDYLSSWCYCDRCLSLFNSEYGRNISRKQLREALHSSSGNLVIKQWISFTRSLMHDVYENYIIKPAKKKNTQIQIFFKLPEWYEYYEIQGIHIGDIAELFERKGR